MRFIGVTAKLGNMRKAVEFTIYPISQEEPNVVTIQSDKRIAQVNLSTGAAMLSDGKGGHQGHWKLRSDMGASYIAIPEDVLQQLKTARDSMLSLQNADGSVNLSKL